MRLEPRVEKLEAAAPPEGRMHVILTGGTGFNEDAALDAYGRDKIAEGDQVQFILLCGMDADRAV